MSEASKQDIEIIPLIKRSDEQEIISTKKSDMMQAKLEVSKESSRVIIL